MRCEMDFTGPCCAWASGRKARQTRPQAASARDRKWTACSCGGAADGRETRSLMIIFIMREGEARVRTVTRQGHVYDSARTH